MVLLHQFVIYVTESFTANIEECGSKYVSNWYFLLQPQVLDTPIKRKDNEKFQVMTEGINCSK